jgi:hypothetical protein
MREWLERAHPWVERAFRAAAWTLRFFRLQMFALFEPRYLEWDARAHTLAAWRYHSMGLCPDDLLVDFADVR